MTKTLTLHIGLPKTGSTFLQETVFPAAKGLIVRCVPKTDLFRSRPDVALERRLFSCCLVRSTLVWKERGEAIWEELLAGEDGDVLISEEGIGRAALRLEHLRAHLEAFHALARSRGYDRLRVMAVIRRQDDWLGSHYAQMSHRSIGAGQAHFERKVEEVLDPARGAYKLGAMLRYDLLYDMLASLVPEEDLFFAPFEALEADEEAFARSVRCFAGMPEPHADEAARTARNVRSAGEGRWKVRPLSVGLPSGRRLHLPIRKGRRVEMTAPMRAGIAAAYAEGNAALAERTGLPLREHGYPLP